MISPLSPACTESSAISVTKPYGYSRASISTVLGSLDIDGNFKTSCFQCSQSVLTCQDCPQESSERKKTARSWCGGGALKTTEGKAEVPSLDKEGWLRPLRKCR